MRSKAIGLCGFRGALAALVILWTSTTHAWFDCEWPYRTELDITEVSGTSLLDYQIRLDLDASAFDLAYTWSANGEDLRVIDSDDTTPLQYFIESWDQAAQRAVVWVKLGTLAANSSRTIYLYIGNEDATDADTELTFTEPGIKFNTRFSTANPSNKAAAYAALDAAPLVTPGYGCTFITDFTGVFNRGEFAPPDRNGNFVAYSESFFEVTAAEAGVWSFRYGGDFGRGGALYVNDIALEEQWNDDLWWAFNWAASSEVLEGSITLTEGYHKLEVIGFEGCCDGGITVQFRKPGGSYQTFQTSAIDVRSRKCPVQDPTVVQGAQDQALPNLGVTVASTVISDPIKLGINPKRIPGSTLRVTLTVTNSGSGTSRTDDARLVSAVPPNTQLYVSGAPVSFVDGAPPSGLVFQFTGLASTTDDVDFSNDNGATFTYIPVADGAGVDGNVTDVRIVPSGKMNCSSAAGDPDMSVSYDVLVQ